MGIKIECPYCGGKKTNVFAVVPARYNGAATSNYDVFCNSCGKHFTLLTVKQGENDFKVSKSVDYLNKKQDDEITAINEAILKYADKMLEEPEDND